MIKRLIANSLSKRMPTSYSDVDCSLFTTCGSCIAQEGCGFCGNTGSCVNGGWFGALDKSTCGLNDYYYHQCHMSTLPLGIITIILIAVAIIAVLIVLSVACCCFCCQCCQGQDAEEDEDRPLLGSKYLRRSSTYYQWNRPPPVTHHNDPASQQQNIASQSSVPVDASSGSLPTAQNWEDRRTALLKKYAREPSPVNE